MADRLIPSALIASHHAQAGPMRMADGLIRGTLIAPRRAQAGPMRIDPPDAATPQETV